MRSTLASLLAGGCLLATATVATADEIRLDDAALDTVAAGQITIDQRRNALLAVASISLAQIIVERYAENPVENAPALPVILPIVGGLESFGVQSWLLAGPEAMAVWGLPPSPFPS